MSQEAAKKQLALQKAKNSFFNRMVLDNKIQTNMFCKVKTTEGYNEAIETSLTQEISVALRKPRNNDQEYAPHKKRCASAVCYILAKPKTQSSNEQFKQIHLDLHQKALERIKLDQKINYNQNLTNQFEDSIQSALQEKNLYKISNMYGELQQKHVNPILLNKYRVQQQNSNMHKNVNLQQFQRSITSYKNRPNESQQSQNTKPQQQIQNIMQSSCCYSVAEMQQFERKNRETSHTREKTQQIKFQKCYQRTLYNSPSSNKDHNGNDTNEELQFPIQRLINRQIDELKRMNQIDEYMRTLQKGGALVAVMPDAASINKNKNSAAKMKAKQKARINEILLNNQNNNSNANANSMNSSSYNKSQESSSQIMNRLRIKSLIDSNFKQENMKLQQMETDLPTLQESHLLSRQIELSGLMRSMDHTNPPLLNQKHGLLRGWLKQNKQKFSNLNIDQLILQQPKQEQSQARSRSSTIQSQELKEKKLTDNSVFQLLNKEEKKGAQYKRFLQMQKKDSVLESDQSEKYITELEHKCENVHMQDTVLRNEFDQYLLKARTKIKGNLESGANEKDKGNELRQVIQAHKKIKYK